MCLLSLLSKQKRIESAPEVPFRSSDHTYVHTQLDTTVITAKTETSKAIELGGQVTLLRAMDQELQHVLTHQWFNCSAPA